MARGSSAYGADGTIIIGTSVDMYGMNTGLKKIQKSINRLKFSLGAALGIGTLGFGAIGKAAINAASDLQEVQNIVDVAFEDMSYMAEAFAETAIENFGMSELAAKQTAGSFMAMGKALGLEKEDAAKMAIRLTALTGDMASFYNISQDYARVAMSAVYTGETETLKRYGIVLTEANLQEYALTQGIQTKVKAMDASTKAMLRYNYILEATKDITGDFIRTQDTWANQIRVLQQRWNQFLITLGSGLITIFTPFIKSLNNVLQAVIQFANILGSILSKLFGIQWQDISAEMGTLEETNEGIGSSADDAAEAEKGVGDAASKSAKKAKQSLAPWDELTDLFKQTASSAGDASGALGDMGVGDIGDLIGGKKPGADGGWGDLLGIDTLFGLGRWLSQKLTEMLKNIDWEKIYAAAKNFGHGLANFLNGLITPELFYQVGRTIANALNTAIYAALAFGERFNWINLGRSIAAGINGFFENFDFHSFAETINTWVKGLLNTIIQILDDTDWELIGRKIGEFIRDIDFLEIFKKVFQIIGKAIEAAFDVLTNMADAAPLETFLLSLFALGKFFTGSTFRKMSKGFSIITSFFSAFGPNGALNIAAMATLSKSAPLLAGIARAISTVSGAAAMASGTTGLTWLTTFGSSLGASLTGLQTAIGSILAGALEFIAVFKTIKNIALYIDKGTASIENMTKNIGLLVTALGIATAAFLVLFGFPAGLIITGVVAAVAAIAGFVSAINEINTQAIEDAFASMFANVEGASHSLDDYMIVFDNVTANITSGLDEVNKSFANLETSRQEVRNTVDVISTISLAMGTERQLTEGEINKLGEAFAGLNSQLTEYVSAYYDTIIMQTKADYEYVKSIQGDSEALKEEYANRIQSLYEAKAAAQTEAEAVGQQATDAYNNYIDVLNNAESTEQDIITAQNALHDASLQVIESSMEMSHQTSEMDTALQEAKDSFDDLQGSLNLADYGITKTDDAVAAVSGTLDEMGVAYTNAKDTIETELDNVNKALETATGTAKTELEEQKTVAESRLGELNTAYATGLQGIQEDVLGFVPGMMEELEKQWEGKNPLFKALFPEDTWVKSEMQTAISKLYGEEGLKGAMDEAWQKLGEEAAPDAEEAAKTILDSFYETISMQNPTAYGTGTTTISRIKDNWKDLSGDMVDGAVEGLNQRASDIVDAANQPYVDSIEAIRKTNNSNSPSVVYHDLSVDMMDGAIWGLDEKGPDFVERVQEIATQAKEAFALVSTEQMDFSLFSNGIQQLASKITTDLQTAITNIKTTLLEVPEWLSTNILFPIDTNITLEIDSVYNKLIILDTNIKTLLTNAAAWFNTSLLTTIKTHLTNFNTYLDTVTLVKFKQIWELATNKVRTLFEDLCFTMKHIMSETIDYIVERLKQGLNQIVTEFKNAIESILELGEGIEGISITGTAGISSVQFRAPGLAKGAVIPPNKKFLAVLGDQKSGTNIEAPLDTIKRAFVETLGSINLNSNTDQGDIVVQIDGYEVFRAVRNQSERFSGSTGHRAF